MPQDIFQRRLAITNIPKLDSTIITATDKNIRFVRVVVHISNIGTMRLINEKGLLARTKIPSA